MSDQPTFLPTTKTQCVLVYVLNALLLFNLTVIVVMLSGTGAEPRPYVERSMQAEAPAAEPERRAVSFDRVSHDEVFTERVSPAAEGVSETGPVVSDQAALYPQPEVLAEKPSAQRVIVPVKQTNRQQPVEHQPAKQPQVKQQPAEQDDPPVTFFGVGIE